MNEPKNSQPSQNNLELRNRAVMYCLLFVIGLLFVLSFYRVQQQPWSIALKKQSTQTTAKTSSKT